MSDFGYDAFSDFEKNKLVEVNKVADAMKMEEDRHLFRKNMEGQLLKFTNMMKGFQYRWVIVNSRLGVVEYYEREEHKSSYRPRASLSLVYATVCPSDEDSQTFVLNTSQGENIRLKAANARERQLWVNHIRAVAEYHTERANEQASISALSSLQRPSLLPVRENRPAMLNSSNSDQSFSTHRSGGNRAGRSTDRSTEATTNAANAESSTFVDPYQQLNELFRLLEWEGNLLGREIDDLYNQPTAAFPNKSPEMTELYRNLLIIKATSQASIKSLKQCLGGLQRDNTSNSSNSAIPVTTEVKTGAVTPSACAVAPNHNTTSSSFEIGPS